MTKDKLEEYMFEAFRYHPRPQGVRRRWRINSNHYALLGKPKTVVFMPLVIDESATMPRIENIKDWLW